MCVSSEYCYTVGQCRRLLYLTLVESRLSCAIKTDIDHGLSRLPVLVMVE